MLRSLSVGLSDPSRTINNFSFALKALSSLLYKPPTTRNTFENLKSDTVIVTAQFDSRIGSTSRRHLRETRSRPGISRVDAGDPRLAMVRGRSCAASSYITFLISAGKEKKLVVVSVADPFRDVALLLRRRENSLFIFLCCRTLVFAQHMSEISLRDNQELLYKGKVHVDDPSPRTCAR